MVCCLFLDEQIKGLGQSQTPPFSRPIFTIASINGDNYVDGLSSALLTQYLANIFNAQSNYSYEIRINQQFVSTYPFNTRNACSLPL